MLEYIQTNANKQESKQKRGRPIEKIGRKKIGLSIDAETDERLSRLSKQKGKTKSQIFIEALKILEEENEIIDAKLKKLAELDDSAFNSMEDYINNRIKSELEKQGG